jgi:dienelactone hydrolase
MYRMLRAVLCLLALFPYPSPAEPRDGKLFDPGIPLTEPAEGAPEGLARLALFLGQWDFEFELLQPGQEPVHSKGIAHITYMNRGHAVMERTRVTDFDGQGHAMATLAFLALDASGTWTVSEGNSWTETIQVMSGGFAEDGRLVLHDALRPGGGPLLLLMRRSYTPGEDSFTMTVEISQDLGGSWAPSAVRRYTRREPSEDFFPVRDDVGLPSPQRAPEGAEFDFLLGEFDARHYLSTPQGVSRWQSNASAVHVLDGHAILEFDHHDQDPNLPDAATSILRIYNRIMRRWESLFLPNRSNRPLHFGGVKEDDRIVLHPFGAQTASNRLNRWIFFDARDDAYRWKGMGSTDRGETFTLSWGIDFVRKGTHPPEALDGAPTEVRTTTADGVTIVGDHYRPAAPAAPTVLLFHQAEGDARGEYGDIARRLWGEGFEVLAWDIRGGGGRFGQDNRTVAAWKGTSPEGNYGHAYPDVEAALAYAVDEGSGGPIYAVGSSFSAALAIRLAAEHRLAGVAAFSPAPGRMGASDVGDWLPRVEGVPVLILRPEGELDHEWVARQSAVARELGVEIFTAPKAAHGASMLHPARSAGDVEPTWQRLLAFFADPGGTR